MLQARWKSGGGSSASKPEDAREGLMAFMEKRSSPKPKGKRYVMRGYGKSGPNVTHVHPRQQKQGKRIVYIPGVGYRHVQNKGKRRS